MIDKEKLERLMRIPLRLREVLAIVQMPEGRLRGWEHRGLYGYAGDERGPGEHRLYSFRDALAFALANNLTDAGLEPETAWRATRENLDRILAGEADFLMCEPTAAGYKYSAHKDVRLMRAVLRLYPESGPRVTFIISAAAICEDLVTRLEAHQKSRKEGQ
jgi:hypothetical protein